jgi:hypothetical protein
VSGDGDRDLVVTLRRIRMDLTAAQAKLTSALELATRLAPAPPPARCPACGLALPSQARLAEHAYLTHDGDEPSHWLDAETRAEEPTTS